MAVSKKIIVHTMVFNDDHWLWYSIMSVLSLADKILVFDNGSSDRSQEIIASIHSPKIEFHQVAAYTPSEIAKTRQTMIDMSKGYDWILLVDADEIWSQAGLNEIKDFISNSHDTVSGISFFYNWVGDIHHFMAEKYGRYQIAGLMGNLTIRLLKNTPDLHVYGTYPLEGYAYGKTKVQHVHPSKLNVFKYRYFHASFLKRSSFSSKIFQRKIRYEFGEPITSNIRLPEVLTLSHPDFVPAPPKHRTIFFILMSWFFSLFRFGKYFIVPSLAGLYFLLFP
jgi:glycosyltransferase involved in cell wall biosynthesis